MPRLQPLRDQLLAAFEIDEFYVGPDRQLLPVTALQRRTCQNNILPFASPTADGIPHRLQPRFAISIVQRNTVPDLFDVCRRVKAVSVHEGPSQLLRQQLSNRRLPRPSDTHHDRDHAELLCEIRPALSKTLPSYHGPAGYRRNEGGPFPASRTPQQPYNFQVTQVSKLGTGVGIAFGLVFAGCGMFGAGAIFLADPAKVHGNPLVGIAVCFIFIAIGAGVVFAVIHGGRKLKQQTALQQASPDSPWLWREDWSISRAESKNRNATIGLWIAAIFWNVISATLAAFALPPLLQKPDLKALIPIAFCLAGVILFVAAVRASVRRERFGKTYFEFSSLPFVPGSRLRGAIHLRFNTTAAHGTDLRLSCVRQVVTGSGDSNTTNQILLWQDMKNVSPDLVASGPMGEAAIPVDFAIPGDALETNHAQSNDQVLWMLHAEADVPGINYSDDFEVPVFRLTPASLPAPASSPSAWSFRNFNSAGVFRASAGVVAAPAFQNDAAEVAAPDHPTVVVSTGPGGGTEFYFPAFRNPARVLRLIFFTLVWTGVVYFLHRSSAPWLFPLIFGCFDILLVYASIQSALGTIRMEVANGKIVIRKSLLGIGSTQEVPFPEIAQILVVTGSYQGTSVKDAQYSIRLLRKNGRKLTLADAIYNRQEARWTVAQMEKLAGLKLDTHVAVDAPFVAHAGYGAPPQRGQAPPVPPPAVEHGRRAATVFGALMFAAWIGYIAFRVVSLPRAVHRATASSGATAAPLQHVSYSPLTDRDEERLRRLPAQLQAEELLERALRHDPRALGSFEQNIGVWLGAIKLTPRMKQLEQRSRFSTDLRVRQANADLNLAMDGWANNEQSAALMIERSQNQPQTRATYVYFMGMLAGRGVAYNRIYPVLVNYAKNDPDAAVRLWSVEGMRFLASDEALDQLFESFTTDASDQVRERAGCNISDCGIFTRKQRMRMVPKFIALVENPQTSPRMRNWSFMALHEITDQNLLPSASAWNDWYRQQGAQKTAQFEQQEWWSVRGDE